MNSTSLLLVSKFPIDLLMSHRLYVTTISLADMSTILVHINRIIQD